MVFDHQLESDRVIDLTHSGSTLLGSITDPSSLLFSIFLRIPLLLLCLILDYSNTIMEDRTRTNTTTTTSQYIYSQKKKNRQLWLPSLRTIDEETKKEVEVELEQSQNQEEDASTIVEEEGATEQEAAPFWHAVLSLFNSTTVSSPIIISVLRRYTVSIVRNMWLLRLQLQLSMMNKRENHIILQTFILQLFLPLS